MTSNVAAGLTGLVAVALAAGCGGTGGEHLTKPPPRIDFLTADLSTGVGVASFQITDYGGDVPDSLLQRVAAGVRVASWPSDLEVASAQTITTVPGGQLANGAQVMAYAQIDETLDAGLDGSKWYAVSAPVGTDYVINEGSVFIFQNGLRGIRLSPAHPPVVASVMSCSKDMSTIAVYVRYSEPVSKAAGVPALDFTKYPVTCSVGTDSPTETQFICVTGAGTNQPFLVNVPDGVTAQASGAPMAPATLDSTGMYQHSTSDGCTTYRPRTVD